MSKIYVINTRTEIIGRSGYLVGSGAVGVFSSRAKAVKALNRQRAFAQKCEASFDVDEEFKFSYHYDNEVVHSYQLCWYELNDETLSRYDAVLPKIDIDE